MNQPALRLLHCAAAISLAAVITVGCTDPDDASLSDDTGVADDADGDAGAELDADSGPGFDAETDTGLDAGADTGSDAGADTGADTGPDAGTDTDLDAGSDAESDTGTDAGTDAGDAGVDAETDAGGETPPAGLSEPCAQGEGWTVWRFSYSDWSTSAQIEVWDASCDYSLAPGSSCNVREVTSGFGDISRTSDGYPIVTTSSDYIRIRYSVEGLQFDAAEVHLQGRSYSTSASTDFRLWSPIYGDAEGGPVSQSFEYEWHSLDWSDYLHPTDDPGLTAIETYAAQGGSSQLAVQSMELCVK